MNRVTQRVAADKPHRIEGPTFWAANFVDRYDARVFELTGEPRFAEEPRHRPRIAGIFRQQFFDGYVPIQLVISGQPDPPNAAGGVNSREAISHLRADIVEASSRLRRDRGS